MRIEDIELEHIIEFRDHGDFSKAPAEIVEFVSMMEKVRGMHVRFDQYGSRDAIIKHLTKFDGLSHYMAAKYHDLAMEYFHADRQISKDAWRGIVADAMYKNISVMRTMADNVQDLERTNKSLLAMAKVLRLDEPDPEPFPEELLNKPFKMYSLDPEYLGLPTINRYDLAKFIDELPALTEKERLMARREALIDNPKLFLDVGEDPRST